MREYDFEPIRGLPEQLPPGEEILWQGSPRWQALARRAFHVRKIAFYFGVLAVLPLAWDLASHSTVTLASGVQRVTWILALAAVSIGALSLLAWAMARSTLYTITNRRVVMRFGVALPMIMNLPFKQVRSAGLRLYDEAVGDIPLRLSDKAKPSYVVFWPHVRPWAFSPVEPMLRAIPDAERVAGLLADALAQYVEETTLMARAEQTSGDSFGSSVVSHNESLS